MTLSQGNEFALVALVLWLPLAGIAFAVARPPLASAIALVGAALCLPHGVVLIAKGFPELGKDEIGALSVLFYCLVFYRDRIVAARPGRGMDLLVLALVAGAVGTALTNRNVLNFHPAILPGLTTRDAISMASRDLLGMGLPFFLGRALFRTGRDLRMLMTTVVVAAVVYSAFAIFEMRMGSQLQHAIYGVHPGIPARRDGIFRPFVFMGGLSLSLFLAHATITSVLLSRAGFRVLGFSAGFIAAFLGAVLFLSRSFASIVYASVVVPVVTLLTPRLQIRVALILSLFSLAYPLLRSLDLVPVDAMVSAAAFVDVDRSQSLAFRFQNEDQLLERARERILFGWGGWNRSAVFDRGRPQTITDGWWIIVFGQRGLVGFLASFGLLTLPVFLASRRLADFPRGRDQRLVSGFGLVVAISTVDLLPNTLWTYFALVFSGALAGVVQGRRDGRTGVARTSQDPPSRPAARRLPGAGAAPARRPGSLYLPDRSSSPPRS